MQPEKTRTFGDRLRLGRVDSRVRRLAKDRERRARKRAARIRARAERIQKDSEALIDAAEHAKACGVAPEAVDSVVLLVWWDELSNQNAGYVHPLIKDLISRRESAPVFRADVETALHIMRGWAKPRIDKRLRFSGKYLLPGPGRSDIFISGPGDQPAGIETTGEQDEEGRKDGTYAPEGACDDPGSTVVPGQDCDRDSGC